jgi:pimeloyl-ACP methyl ester carboxylesterase
MTGRRLKACRSQEDFMNIRKRNTTLPCALAALGLFAMVPAFAATSCAGLASLALPEVTSIAATLVTGGTITPPAPNPPVTGLPPLCRVSLVVAPQIKVEVWLPVTWNQRFMAVGGGGYAGDITWPSLGQPLRAGYATSSTDTGHSAATGGGFALNPDGTLNEQLIVDFASRSLHEMTVKAQMLINAYYGQAPKYNYWVGGSTGGRQGLMEAQRFPTDYDGILAGCPAINWDRFIPSELWPQIVMKEELGAPIAASKLNAVNTKAVAACDANDGVIDGVINEPRKCGYDPAAAICKAGDDPAACLTIAEANAVRKIWNGPTTQEGKRLWFGTERGASFGGLSGPNPFSIAVDHFRYWIHQNPSFDWRTVTETSFGNDFKLSEQKFDGVIGTDDDNLQALRKAGGKLIIYHGEWDNVIFPRGTQNYYERVLTGNGGANHVTDFARLFMVPGVGHCVGGPGPNAFGQWLYGASPPPLTPDADHDMFLALMRWVEQGIAPDRIIATKYVNDNPAQGVLRTRPLCVYPKVAQWTGRGSTDDAANFACVDTDHDADDIKVTGPR